MYTVSFKIENQSFQLDKMNVDEKLYGFDEAFVQSRMEDKKRKHPKEHLNIAYQVLKKYHDAYDIIVVKKAQAVMAVLLLVVLLVFGAIIQAFYMFGHPKKGNLFKNVLNLEQYKKFRKLYLIIGGSLYACFLAFFIVCIIVLKDLVTASLFMLAGYNVIYFIVAVIIGNNIWKKYHVDEPQLPPESTDDDPEFAAQSQPDSDSTGNKAIEELKQYKALLDQGAITKKEFEAKKREILFGEAPRKKTPASLVSSWIMVSLAILFHIYLFVWWGTFTEYAYSNDLREGFALYELLGNPYGLFGEYIPRLVLSIVFNALSTAALVAMCIGGLYQQKNKRMITIITLITSMVSSAVLIILPLTYINARILLDIYFTGASTLPAIISGGIIILLDAITLLLHLKKPNEDVK